jgi:hypothetical protein
MKKEDELWVRLQISEGCAKNSADNASTLDKCREMNAEVLNKCHQMHIDTLNKCLDKKTFDWAAKVVTAILSGLIYMAAKWHLFS